MNAISIHALREEGDSENYKAILDLFKFLSTPSARRATGPVSFSPIKRLFLSTPSARRATRKVAAEVAAQQDFYPRPLRGGRRSNEKQNQMIRRFLSTPSARRATPTPRALPGKVEFLSTPSARRATGVSRPLTSDDLFLSTPSARRATPYRAAGVQGFIISIHALCEEGDPYIQPRSYDEILFLSTPSARRATAVQCAVAVQPDISIHALCEEGDSESAP